MVDRLCATAPLDHYAPWLKDLRKDKPYQLEDRIEQVFHEKSVTGRGAWNRLSTRPWRPCVSRWMARR